jgi:microcystin-dependent protein
MRLKIDLQIPQWTKWLVGGVAIGLALGVGGWRVYADVPNSFKAGDTVSAQNLNDNFAALTSQINTLGTQLAAVQGQVPAGTVLALAGPTPPPGFLLCDGAPVSRTQYVALFATLQIMFGGGDGINTFNLPDLRGRVVIAAGQGSGLTIRAIGQLVGEETHVLTTQEMPSHQHTGSTAGASGISSSFTEYNGNGANQRGYSYVNAANGGADMKGHTHSFTTDLNGGGAAHNNMPPSVVLNYVIKT